MRYFVLLMIFVSASLVKARNPIWVHQDKQLILTLVAIKKDSVQLMEDFFGLSNQSQDKKSLGFGWAICSPYKSGGYFSIRSNFYYFKDSLVAYEISPQLPNNRTLINKYKKWLNNYFDSNTDEDLIPLKYKMEQICAPLPFIEDSLKTIRLDGQLATLMQPSSDIRYYWSGGYVGSMPLYRKIFLDNADSLSYKELKFMTYSKNPVTRFMAIEEIYRRNYQNTESTSGDKDWFELCFIAMPMISTLTGCLGTTEKSKNLVWMFSKLNYH